MGSERIATSGFAYREGRDAKEAGLARVDCPYRTNYPVMRGSWLRGWDEAEPTITVPVTEYEELRRRAKVYEAVDWEVILDIVGRSGVPGSDVQLRAITAAIKEQEG